MKEQKIKCQVLNSTWLCPKHEEKSLHAYNSSNRCDISPLCNSIILQIKYANGALALLMINSNKIKIR